MKLETISKALGTLAGVFCVMAGAGLIISGGCSLLDSKESITDTATGTAANLGLGAHAASGSVMNLGVLDWLFGVCILAAAASVLLAAFKLPVPPKLTASLVLVAVAAVAAKVLLVKYEWLIGLLCIAGVVLAGVVFAMTRVGWLERKLGRDINRNGKVGT